MKVRTIQDRILVKREEAAETTSGGIIVPKIAQKKMNQGLVVSVGKGKLLENGTVHPPEVKVGDRILFGEYSGAEIKVDGEDHIVLKEEEILGIVED